MSGIECSIGADEVVAAGTTITLTLEAPADPRSAQGAVRLMRRREPVDLLVALGKRGRKIQVALPEDLLGACELVVSELLGVDGTRLVDAFRLKFSVIPVSGKVPADVRIEHAVRLVIGELETVRLAPGQGSATGHVDVMKTVHRKSGAMVELAFDHDGKRVDIAEQFARLAERRNARFGRLDPTLFQRMEKAADGDRLTVRIWPSISLPPAPYEKPADRRSLEPPPGELEVLKTVRKARAALAAVLERGKIKATEKVRDDDAVPCIAATATVKQLRELAKDKAIGVIHFDDPTSINDLGDSIAVARSDRAHTAGFDGTGIRVAVWENGPKELKNLTFAGRFTTSPSASDHARLTSAIVKNNEANKPHGHAPGCDLFSANTDGVDALNWAVRDQHCTVISQSFHRGSEPGGSGLQSDDLFKDWLVLRWPYPTILQAAGNFFVGDNDNIQPPESEFVNHKGFNSLAIGNHDDTASSMSGDSVFRNPTSSHGDRELPELAANGTGVSANDQTMSGTSFAAPATAGVTAILQDVDNTLCSWPEGCRAILLAAAGRNVRDSTWWQDVMNRVDARDGSGAVDAIAGVAIAQQRRFRNAPATRNGWDVGTLDSSAFGADGLTTFRYHVVVPFRVISPHVKVALAWDSEVAVIFGPFASVLTVDFDLLVFDSTGRQVAGSASWDNSYEIAEFDAHPGQIYDIVVRRWSGTHPIWYGIAWTVTGTRFIFPGTDVLQSSTIQFG